MAKKKTPKEAWYAEGLRFECAQCGNCCTGAPGYVFVTRDEIERISTFLGRGEAGLGKEHLRRVGLRSSLTEDKKTGDCCFLHHTPDGKRTCGIYPVRPLQCRTWPFWDTNLATPAAWNQAARNCPGMNEGRRHEFVAIEIRRTADDWGDLDPCPTPSAT